jgi:DNA-binding MarR family transcriptional regulator
MRNKTYIARIDQLTEPQRKTLRYLESCKEGCGGAELAVHLGRTRSLAGRLMRDLIDAGLATSVTLRNGTARYCFYQVTEAGIALVTKGELPSTPPRVCHRLEDYKPAKWEPARPGALDHTKFKSLGV